MNESMTGGQPRIAVVGGGRWGRNHVRNYAEIGALAAVVDRDPDTAHALATQHGVPARSFEEALADPVIEGIVLALPPSQNVEFGSRALEAGKHLFVEKPMTLETGTAEALERLAEARGRALMVGHILQYHPVFLSLLDLVRAGRLGRVRSIVSTRLDFGRIRREEDALWALAPHDLSMILALAGEEPASVSASGGRHTHPTIADNAFVELGFPGGARAEIRVSWLHPFKEQRLVVVGEAGMAVFDDREPWERKLVVMPTRITETEGRILAEKDEPQAIGVAQGEPLREECLHFLGCIRSGERPRTDGREGLAVLRCLERASAAMAAG